MDFAPYQDANPERVRALSPPPPGSRALSPTSRNATKSPPPSTQTNANRDPFTSSQLPAPSHFNDSYQAQGNGGGFSGVGAGGGRGGGDLEGGRFGVDVNLFETSLPLRLDYEAVLAYLLLPPAGGVFLLVVEHKSDYVRYVLEVEEATKKKSLQLSHPIGHHRHTFPMKSLG